MKNNVERSHNPRLCLYLNGDGGLLILVSGEDLRFLCWDDSVSGDQLGHYSTNSFNSKGKRGNVKKKDICMGREYQYC